MLKAENKKAKSLKRSAGLGVRLAVRPTAGLLAAGLLLFSTGCAGKESHIVPNVTVPPAVQNSESIVPATESAATAVVTATAAPATVDALGKTIRSADHFEQYLRFANFRVFEEGDGTFVDGTVINSYPETLYCAVNIFFTANDGSENVIASGNMQSADGSFMLTLAPGENLLFASVLTDTVLTSSPFTLVFDSSVGVRPGH